MIDRLAALLKNPKVQKVALNAGIAAAGAHGGPLAAQWVREYGPAVLNALAKLLGG